MKATTSTAGSSRSMNFVTEAVAEDVVEVLVNGDSH